MKCFITFISSMLFLHGYSQKEKFLVKFSPLALIDQVSFPAIQGGAEFRLSRSITWYNELGIKYLKSYMDADTSFLPSSGFKVKTEFRYYFQKRAKTEFEGAYFAINGFFIRDIHNTEIVYFPNNDSSRTVSDAFGVKKNVFGSNLIIGYQNFISKRFAFDFYGGFGVRFRIIHTVNKEFDKNTDVISSPIDLNIPAMRHEVDANGGNSVVPNFTLGLRLVYRLYDLNRTYPGFVGKHIHKGWTKKE